MTRTTRALLTACAVTTIAALAGHVRADSIHLTVTWSPPSTVHLAWTPDHLPYVVFRASTPSGVDVPANQAGTVTAAAAPLQWDDTHATGTIAFYLVDSEPCVSLADCPATACMTPLGCTGYACDDSFAPPGTPTPTQTAGDCRREQCDGLGGTVSVPDDTDIPDDGNPCTNDVCQNGTPTHPSAVLGTPCNVGNGTHCREGVCDVTTMTVRVGDGAAALSSAATAVFVEERFSDGSQYGSAIPLPTATSGSNVPCTLSGSASSEGALARSGDASVVSLACYAAAVGTASVASSTSASVNRVAASIDANHAVNSSTRFDAAFSGNNVRSAVSNDGLEFWAAGATGGVWYAPRGTIGGTQILTTPGNVRWVSIAGGQLYADSSSSGWTSVFSIGIGLPVTAGQSATLLPGLPATGASPYGYAFVDHDPNVAGVDTLYLADDRAVASGGGVQKWTFNGITWSLAATFNNGLTSGVRGLAVAARGDGSVLVFATTAESPTNRLVSFVDDFVVTNPAATTLATSSANTVYRGVAIGPR